MMMLLRPGRWVAVLAVVLAWPLGAAAAASPPIPAASVLVTSDGGVDLVSVTAQVAPLRALLSEVARLPGLQVEEVVPTGRTVSVEFKGLPLDQALKRLLSAEDFIFVYDQPGKGDSTKLRRVILLGPSTQQQEGPITRPAQAALEYGQPFDPDAPLEQLLPLTDHHDPRRRRAALEALTLHEGDDQARRKLMDHIRDPDPNIRSVVVGLLGPFVTQWPGAEDVMMTALHDAAARVRRLALQTLWESSSPKLSEALQLGLLDEEPGVRARAEELLRNTSVKESDEPGPGRGTFSPSEGP
jgi:hypothetical protein